MSAGSEFDYHRVMSKYSDKTSSTMCMRWNQELHKHHAFDRGLAFCVRNTLMTNQCKPRKASTAESMERASTNRYLDSRSSENRVFTEERAIPVKVRKQENMKL